MTASAPRLVVVENNPKRVWRIRLLIAALWIGSLLVSWYWVRAVTTPGLAQAESEIRRLSAELSQRDDEVERLKTEVARFQRGEQVAESATGELQNALLARQEEISSLRADLNFFERLMEGGQQRPGLSIHSLQLAGAGDPRAFQFALTLSQNLKRNRPASGIASLTISGTRADKSERLTLADLGQDSDALSFNFKYFQQLAGLVTLPEGFRPMAVRVRLKPEDGAVVEREFLWSEVIDQDDDKDE
jgi:hypothetical protein